MEISALPRHSIRLGRCLFRARAQALQTPSCELPLNLLIVRLHCLPAATSQCETGHRSCWFKTGRGRAQYGRCSQFLFATSQASDVIFFS